MKTIKRISSDYDIHSANVTVYGNLLVVGDTTQVGSINTLIYDNFVTLSAGQAGGPTLTAGVEVDRGPGNLKVGLRWNEPTLTWQYTNDGSNWENFSEMRLLQDPNPILGGDLIVNDFVITSDPGKDVVITVGTGGNLKIGPIIRLPEISSDPTSLAGHNTIYAKTAGSGSTGIYVTNQKSQAEELVTNRKSLLYSLIF